MATVSAPPRTTSPKSQTPTKPPAEQHDAIPLVAPTDAEPLFWGDRIGLWVWLVSMLILLGLGLVGQFVYYFGQV